MEVGVILLFCAVGAVSSIKVFESTVKLEDEGRFAHGARYINEHGNVTFRWGPILHKKLL